MLAFVEEGKLEKSEKNPQSIRQEPANIWLCAVIELGPNWWEANILTYAPSLLPTTGVNVHVFLNGLLIWGLFSKTKRDLIRSRVKGSHVLIKSFCVCFHPGCGILSKTTTTYFLLMAVALKLGRLSTVYHSTKWKARHLIENTFADLLNVNGGTSCFNL